MSKRLEVRGLRLNLKFYTYKTSNLKGYGKIPETKIQ
jgi:hypothetical protein